MREQLPVAINVLRLLCSVPAVRQVMNASGQPHEGNCGCPWCAAQAVIHGATRTAPEGPILFYGPEHYVLSNFSAFQLRWRGHTFPTSEHAYHWEKFRDSKLAESELQRMIREAPSAHEAYKLAERNKVYRRAFWDTDKVDEMRDIIRAKAQQHEYVQRKLIETGDRELIEDSWRDDYWGWGPNRDGQNMLGKLWMEIRAELRAAAGAKP